MSLNYFMATTSPSNLSPYFDWTTEILFFFKPFRGKQTYVCLIIVLLHVWNTFKHHKVTGLWLETALRLLGFFCKYPNSQLILKVPQGQKWNPQRQILCSSRPLRRADPQHIWDQTMEIIMSSCLWIRSVAKIWIGCLTREHFEGRKKRKFSFQSLIRCCLCLY